MFKRTALALSLLALPFIAAAQQPAAWPWQPVQVWAVPANGQAVPFPTPFWLWMIPPAVAPASAPVVKTQPAPTSPAAVVPPAAMPATVSTPVAVPAAAVVKPVAPVEQPADKVVATPSPPALSVAPAEIPAVPASVEVPPAPVKRAPVAKKIRKPVAGAPTRPVRKLCFKGGKLDVCP